MITSIQKFCMNSLDQKLIFYYVKHRYEKEINNNYCHSSSDMKCNRVVNNSALLKIYYLKNKIKFKTQDETATKSKRNDS